MNLLDLLIAPAHAQAAGAAPQGGGLGVLLMPIALIAIMYFLMIRPQMKKQKEHRAMLEKLAVGDEVITSGGIGGVVRSLGESFQTVEIADRVEIRAEGRDRPRPAQGHAQGGLIPADAARRRLRRRRTPNAHTRPAPRAGTERAARPAPDSADESPAMLEFPAGSTPSS